MTTPADHRGIAEDDPRNRGPIAFFKPKKVTLESTRESFARALPRASAGDIDMRARQFMADIEGRRFKPPPPLSQSLEEVEDPHYGLSTHPDIIEHLWKLDCLLPQKCRWVFWGRPALVHPQTGVVFAVGFGTIGTAMRLPPHVLENADSRQARVVKTGNPGQRFDIEPMGPEWRFVTPPAPETEWCRAAYEFAAEPAG